MGRMPRIIFFTAFYVACAGIFSACATSSGDVGDNQYPAAHIAGVMSPLFDTDADALERALAPSYKAHGAPSAYVSGLMSVPGGADGRSLLGTGEHRIKYQLPRDVFWEIGGAGFAALERPLPTLHLLYDRSDADDGAGGYSALSPQIRRGVTFTVFERMVDERLVITAYRTDQMPRQADMRALSFAPISANFPFGAY